MKSLLPPLLALLLLVPLPAFAQSAPDAQPDISIFNPPPKPPAPAPAPPPASNPKPIPNPAPDPAPKPGGSTPDSSNSAPGLSGSINVGVNLTTLRGYTTELPFVDAFKVTGIGATPISNPDGKLVTQNTTGNTKLSAILFYHPQPGHYPSGDYTLLYDGEGNIQVAPILPGKSIQTLQTSPGRIVYKIDSQVGRLQVTAVPTNPKNPIRNIRFILPGFENTYQENPWNPQFLKRLQGFSCIRFADAIEVNNSIACHWRDRARVSHANYLYQGLPYELCIDLCNRVDADAWFCIPHNADSEYVESLARLIKEKLAPSHKVYIEYSNEIWNPLYTQHAQAIKEALKLWPDTPAQSADLRFSAYRSKQYFAIFQTVLGSSHHLVRVLGAPANDTGAAQTLLDFDSVGTSADAIAIAPLLNAGRLSPDQPDTVRTTPSYILTRLQNKSLPDAIAQMQAYKKLAAKNHLKLIAYAAGPSLELFMGHWKASDLAFAQSFAAASRDPLIVPILEKYYQAWSQNGSGVIAVYPFISPAVPYTLPGLLEYIDQDPRTSPKWLTTLKYARQLGQNVPSP